MIYLKIGLGLVCLALGANLVFLIHKWMPQIDLKILIGVVILFLLPCITFNTLFPAFYFHFFCLLLIMQLVYFLFHKPVNLLLFLIPLLLTSSILGYGIYNLHHIKPTSYTLFTDKDIVFSGSALSDRYDSLFFNETGLSSREGESGFLCIGRRYRG